jgi:peptide/nickel transport system substrate-binding protein
LTRTLRTALTAVIVVALGGFVFFTLRRPASLPSPLAATAARGGTLRALLRGDPSTFNRYYGRPENALELLAHVLHAKVVRVNRLTDELEPWLAERWTEDPDGLTYTVFLRKDVTFSDGAPFTSADVLFAFEAVYAKTSASPLGDAMRVREQPLAVAAIDPHTVRIRFPSRFAPGLRILDNLPILPRHRLEPAFRDGTFAQAWTLATPSSEMPGLGPFVMAEYQPGRRLVVTRNPRYWRRDASGQPLPYLDAIEFEIVSDQNAEVLRLESGQADLMFSEIRPEDYASLRRLEQQGRVRLVDAGIGLDPTMFWFNLDPAAKASDPRRGWLQAVEFRRAVSHAIDRDALVNSVFLGAAVPVFGPVSPGNKTWYTPDIPKYAYDPARARALLAGLGLSDRDGDGILEDRAGRPVRLSLLTNQDNTVRVRSASVFQEHLRRVGVQLDVTTLDAFSGLVPRFAAKNYDAIYFVVEVTSTDPANNMDFWHSAGQFHLWHPAQPSPSTEWERRIDALMQRVAASSDQQERHQLFADVQRIFCEQAPILYFAAPRIIVPMSPRVRNAMPVLLKPAVMWNPDVLALAPGGPS